jgi:hypothetical protein
LISDGDEREVGALLLKRGIGKSTLNQPRLSTFGDATNRHKAASIQTLLVASHHPAKYDFISWSSDNTVTG